MYQQDVEITAEHGLHTRPAAQFVTKAKEYDCQVTLAANGKESSAKSLFKLQTLGIKKGTLVTISAEGEGAKDAVQFLSEFIVALK